MKSFAYPLIAAVAVILVTLGVTSCANAVDRYVDAGRCGQTSYRIYDEPASMVDRHRAEPIDTARGAGQ